MTPAPGSQTSGREVVLVIPARYGSSRFPGKPLAMLAGRTLLERVLRIGHAVRGVARTYVTTDDERVAAHARSLGAPVLMTTAGCPTGSDRVAQAIASLPEKPHAVLNLQGDAVLTPPWVLEALLAPLVDARPGDPLIVTPAVRLDQPRYEAFLQQKQKSPTSGTTVTLDKRGRALYFSKAVLPFLRTRGERFPSVYRHIGVYGYTWTALQTYASLPQSELELTEGLEQLRALENGIPVQVAVVDYRGRTHASVDAPEDVAVAEALIQREGELVP